MFKALQARLGLLVIPRHGCHLLLCAVLATNGSGASADPVAERTGEESFGSDPVVTKLKPERAHGSGFKMIYSVAAAPATYWRYRTDFEGQLVLQNKFITSHQLVSRDGNTAVTGTVYTKKPNTVFKWQTTVFPDRKLLEYELLNPAECGQRYHYGSVQLEALDGGTRVTHIAYFDFFGVSLWVNYPFKGGMSRFLKYTASWEQQLVAEFDRHYAD
jgi:hypothetical protein